MDDMISSVKNLKIDDSVLDKPLSDLSSANAQSILFLSHREMKTVGSLFRLSADEFNALLNEADTAQLRKAIKDLRNKSIVEVIQWIVRHDHLERLRTILFPTAESMTTISHILPTPVAEGRYYITHLNISDLIRIITHLIIILL